MAMTLPDDLREMADSMEQERAVCQALLVQCRLAAADAESGGFGKPSWGEPMRRILDAIDSGDLAAVKDLCSKGA